MSSFKNYMFGPVLCGAILTTFSAFAQQAPKAEAPKNWHTLDFKTDGYYGISLNQAYKLVQGKKSKNGGYGHY